MNGFKRLLREAALARKLRPIDVEFGIRLGELESDFNPSLAMAALLASRAIGLGHSCVPIEDVEAELETVRQAVGDESIALPDVRSVLSALQSSSMVTRSPQDLTRPLTIEHNRLYLNRYAEHERRCAHSVLERLALEPEAIGTERLSPQHADYLLSDPVAGEINYQAVAIAIALRHRFSILSGGPGTGKTFTLTLIALMLMERAQVDSPEASYKVALAAPTGKAAQRLREALSKALEEFADKFAGRIRPADLAYLQASGTTLHRLLGFRPGEIEFRHHEANPLDVDCLIIDECSMLDLPLITRTLAAMPVESRVLLVGDRHQLLPVEAGNLFSILFDLSEENRVDAATAKALDSACNIQLPIGESYLLNGHVTVLQYSYRSNEQVYEYARSIQDSAAADPGSDSTAKVRRFNVPRTQIASHLARRFRDHDWYRSLTECDSPVAALDWLSQFRILCALRKGPYGVAGINAAMAELIAKETGTDTTSPWYHLRPVMVTANDPSVGLFNGDVGIAFGPGNDLRSMRIYFPSVSPGELIKVLPSQLPNVDTCYAMTIHKSQGSEFDRIAVILPHEVENQTVNSLLTRELIYTAVTRAKSGVEIWSPAEVLEQAIAREAHRYSGLAERMISS